MAGKGLPAPKINLQGASSSDEDQPKVRHRGIAELSNLSDDSMEEKQNLVNTQQMRGNFLPSINSTSKLAVSGHSKGIGKSKFSEANERDQARDREGPQVGVGPGQNVVHTADRFILTDDNPNYQLPFVFTEEEIKDAFETLDIHRHNYITSEEVAFFLDILGEQASEAEIEEMIRMLDVERTHKVYLQDFRRMALGKSLSPIGVAYPPTIPLLQKQNINKLSNVDIVGKIKGTGDQVAFIKERAGGKDEQANAAKRAQIEKMDKVGAEARKQELAQREKLIRQIMEDTKLDIGKIINKLKLKKQREVIECSLKIFSQILERDEDDKVKRIYDSLCPAGSPYFDVREFVVNCIALNGWTNREKARMAFTVFDHENTNQIYFQDFVNIIFWLNLEGINEIMQKSVCKNVQKIFKQRELKQADPISRLTYEQIVDEHQFVLFTHRFGTNN